MPQLEATLNGGLNCKCCETQQFADNNNPGQGVSGQAVDLRR
jgi:hypothetical protein